MQNLVVGFELEALLLTGQCIDIAAKTREQVRAGRWCFTGAYIRGILLALRRDYALGYKSWDTKKRSKRWCTLMKVRHHLKYESPA